MGFCVCGINLMGRTPRWGPALPPLLGQTFGALEAGGGAGAASAGGGGATTSVFCCLNANTAAPATAVTATATVGVSIAAGSKATTPGTRLWLATCRAGSAAPALNAAAFSWTMRRSIRCTENALFEISSGITP